MTKRVREREREHPDIRSVCGDDDGIDLRGSRINWSKLRCVLFLVYIRRKKISNPVLVFQSSTEEPKSEPISLRRSSVDHLNHGLPIIDLPVRAASHSLDFGIELISQSLELIPTPTHQFRITIMVFLLLYIK